LAIHACRRVSEVKVYPVPQYGQFTVFLMVLNQFTSLPQSPHAADLNVSGAIFDPLVKSFHVPKLQSPNLAIEQSSLLSLLFYLIFLDV